MVFAPKEVMGVKVYESSRQKWWGIFTSFLGMAVILAAVQCSVVGSCHVLTWAYVAFMCLCTVVMVGLFLAGLAFGKQMEADAKKQ